MQTKADTFTIYATATDTDSGTDASAFSSERAALEFLLADCGTDWPAFEQWQADNGKDESDFYDYVETVKEDLDSYTYEPVDFILSDIPAVARLIAALARADSLLAELRAHDLDDAEDVQTIEDIRAALNDFDQPTALAARYAGAVTARTLGEIAPYGEPPCTFEGVK